MQQQENQQQTVKIKLSFDGWHCLSKRQTQDILKRARNLFLNANFVDGVGLLIEDNDELRIFNFCLEIIECYKINFGGWNGYEIKKISRKILSNFADRKRKLHFDYFKKLIKENDFQDAKVVLAGILYLKPDEVGDLLVTLERDFGQSLKEMDDEELGDGYRILLMYSSSKDRTFSISNAQL